MKRMKTHLSAIMGRMLFIGFSVQIVFGLFWMLCNFGARQDFAMRSDGLLYPVLLKLAPHYCVVYFFQAAAALGAGYFFLKTIRPSLFWNIWGSLAIFTVPMGMQCHLALLPDSLISSLMLMQCALFWKAVSSKGKRTILFAEMAGCWLGLALLEEMYLYFGGILPLLLLLVTVCGRERFRIVSMILLFSAFVGILFGTYDLAKATGAYEKEPKRISEMMFDRFVWSTILREWENWPTQLADIVDGPSIISSSYYADASDIDLKPALSSVLSQEEMDKLFVDLAKMAWNSYPKRIIHECGWDLAGYVFSPAIAGLMLEGRGCASYCLRNYDIMGRTTPKLTQYYVDYACRWFSAAFLLAVLMEIITVFDMGKAEPCRKIRYFGAYMTACLCPVLWYVAQGAGMMDYKRTVFITGLWIVWQVQKAQGVYK